MARKKVKLAWINSDSARKATFKKRKAGLMKKVSELSTLCGVSACAVVYGPSDQQPEVWPSQAEAHRILVKFRSLPNVEQSKKMMNQEGFLKERIAKLKEQLKKQHKENREYEVSQLMQETLVGRRSLNEMGVQDLSDLAWLVDDKMKAIHGRIEKLRRSSSSSSQVAAGGISGVHHHHHQENRMPIDMAMDSLNRSQAWFMDPQQHINYDHMMVLPYGDWNNAYYP